MRIIEVRTQNLVNLIGLQTERPVLSWKLKAEENGQKQTAYRIVAADTEERLRSGEYNVWDRDGKMPCHFFWETDSMQTIGFTDSRADITKQMISEPKKMYRACSEQWKESHSPDTDAF